MHDESSRSAAEEADMRSQAEVLDLLMSEGVLWSDEEIARAIGDPVAAADAIGALARAGLVHRLSGFVFASRSAVRATRLA